ncbi:hypothetical protein FDJ32_gp07 [Pseudomonas phage NV1]|uniref:Uncharacterized protein n=1 Tax=Pseudomonas phage NV1 TaxID=2079543 RepID=A0A2L0HPL4_9CAUD|nr:hypothetical protein FDJ32_gp07 [Pseudomonas phage NV1]AUX83636.1 hypothetical protein NV1_p07 [Pseudomonas phage NV1]
MSVKVIDKNPDEVIKRFGDLTVGDWFVISRTLFVKESANSARKFPLYLPCTVSGPTKVCPVDVELCWEHQIVEGQEDGI